MFAGNHQHRIGIGSAAALVIANMIGTGVFTSLGLQLTSVRHPLPVLLIWMLGALAALCGAMVYGELASAMPRSGGEYNYLTRIYHPAVGFMSGWISVCVGFPAPIALASMAFGTYFSRVFPAIPPLALAVTVLCALTLVHCSGVKPGTALQNFFTSFTVALIIVFIASGLFFSRTVVPVPLAPSTEAIKEIGSPAFAVSLVYATYAYSGWNASAYIAGEMNRPQQNVPVSLVLGTSIVAALYLLLNYTFLSAATVDELAGRIDVGYITAANIYGSRGADIVSCILSVLLLSSISAFIFVGPRIAQVMGEDYRRLSFLTYRNSQGVPVTAMLMQFSISLLLILSATFEKVLVYAGFSLNLCTFLTVFGIFFFRRSCRGMRRPYVTWGYPVVPLLFLAIMGWNLVYLLAARPAAALAGLGMMLLGLVFYRLATNPHLTAAGG